MLQSCGTQESTAFLHRASGATSSNYQPPGRSVSSTGLRPCQAVRSIAGKLTQAQQPAVGSPCSCQGPSACIVHGKTSPAWIVVECSCVSSRASRSQCLPSCSGAPSRMPSQSNGLEASLAPILLAQLCKTVETLQHVESSPKLPQVELLDAASLRESGKKASGGRMPVGNLSRCS